MKRRSKIILSSVIALSLTGGVVAYAKSGHHGFHVKERLTQKLELDSQQSSTLESLIVTMKDSKHEFRQNGFFDFNQMILLLEDQQLDQQKAMELVREKLTAIENQAQKVIASAAGFTNSLTDEQRAELQSMAEKRAEHHRQHRRHHHDHEEAE
ncbi:MAG: hypothetical protein GKR95_09680 [Gammaproteobacteria bacterium]|nr:hypothetical protein [Gammaproteobacteria bacterium]